MNFRYLFHPFSKIIEFTTKKFKNLATLQNFALKIGCRHVVGSFYFGRNFSQLRECFSGDEKEMKHL